MWRFRIFGKKQDSFNNLRDKVKSVYSTVAIKPSDKHSFPTGRKFAQDIGYPKDVLDKLPDVTVNSFAGVSNVSIYAEIPQGVTVLDLGCGAGLDTLIAAQKVGNNGHVIGIDFSEAMIVSATNGAEQVGYKNVKFQVCDAESIPIPDSSIDIALVNGIFNLNPCREKVFLELYRVLKAGCLVFASELILKEPVASTSVCSLDNWFK
jgi:SAM-dependent methyltransferase